ncbi:MAG: hypothetical protein M3245_03305 [Actinomycetota bacterium]|nr:hypothetical protein [Actinomycetota bacterium]
MRTDRDMQRHVEAPDVEAAETTPEGLVVADMRREGAWGAIQELRSSMRRLGTSASVRATFLAAVDDDGREVEGLDPSASTLLLGYES